MALTKEEKFIIALYEEALSRAKAKAAPDEEIDLDTIEVDSIEIGKRIGMHPTGIDRLCKQLFRSNFIKKREGDLIIITQNGCRLYKDIRGV